jgi:hypothetical protein
MFHPSSGYVGLGIGKQPVCLTMPYYIKNIRTSQLIIA